MNHPADQPLSVLIVEDNLTNRKLSRAQLEGEGILVYDAEDGRAALDLLEQLTVQAIISDILMPRMDGYRLCYEIRKHPRFQRLPFIFYTSTYTSASDEALAGSLGGDCFLRKPASVQEISNALHDLLLRGPRKPCGSPETIEELSLLKEYSERLVAKLEDKHVELDQCLNRLQATQAQLRHLLDFSPAVLYAWKLEGQQIIPRLISENITNLLGFSVSETLSYVWWFSHLHPEDRERAVAGVQSTLRLGVSRTEYRLLHRQDSSYRWVQDSRRLLRDAVGRLSELIGIWLDIAERKQAEQTVQPLADLVKSSEDAIISKSLEGRVTSWNPAAERIYGYTETEMLGRSISSLLPTDRSGEEQQLLHRIGQRGDLVHIQTRRLRKDGAQIDLALTLSPIRDAAGKVVGASKIARDITAKKRAQAELEKLHAQLREDALRIGREEIARTVVHNIGNVLTSIKVSTSAMAQKLERSKAAKLEQVAALLQEHKDDLPAFFSQDPKGTKLVGYLLTWPASWDGSERICWQNCSWPAKRLTILR